MADESSGITLTPTSAKALGMLHAARAEGRDPHGVVANTMDAPYLSSGQVILSVATGRALERRGLIRIEDGESAYLIRAAGEGNT